MMRNYPAEAFVELEEGYFGSRKHESAEIEKLPVILRDVRCFADVGASFRLSTYFASKVLKGADFLPKTRFIQPTSLS